jgi:hypothetical protein
VTTRASKGRRATNPFITDQSIENLAGVTVRM